MAGLKFKVLVIDDDPMTTHTVCHHLMKDYEVITATRGDEGLRLASFENPHLILLDLHMPGADGFQVCHSLRTHEATKDIPIIIITGNSNLDNRVRAFGLGADDLISKPISGPELQARVQSKVRRIRERSGVSQIISCGNLVVDVDQHEVRVNDQVIELSALEVGLLVFMIKNKGKILNRTQILEGVWKGYAVSKRTIDTHILSLRKKLDGFNWEIVSVYGVGYGLKDTKLSN